MGQTYYFIEISNDYLGRYRKITGRSKREVEFKAADQLQRWAAQEERERERRIRAEARTAVEDAKEQAREETEEALAAIEEHRSILRGTLDVDDRLDWSALEDHTPFKEVAPTLVAISKELEVPEKRAFAERLSKKTASRRIELEEKASAHLEERRRAFEDRRALHEREQGEHNRAVQDFRRSYEVGEADAVERYISLVLAGSVYPATFSGDYAVSYSPTDSTMVVNIVIPRPDDLPTTLEVKYIATRKTTEAKAMKEKDVADLYDQVVVQTVLRTLHEIFEADYAERCSIAIVNAVVKSVDRATGRDFMACVASCQAERSAFSEIDLSRVDPVACFRGLKGLSGGRMIDIQPVRPIRVLDTSDPRFIEAQDVLDGLEAGANLMTMDWQAFEMLVRDLLAKMFDPKGGEVKVTRASRDQGVDAVVFDPDPLLGGKSVIQAKRYRGAVPVAAVRELYGTMINEGAGKGILVTTSHFGASALEFAKDKPLTLLDGAHLLHLLQVHGHRLRIDVTEGAPDPVLDEIPG